MESTSNPSSIKEGAIDSFSVRIYILLKLVKGYLAGMAPYLLVLSANLLVNPAQSGTLSFYLRFLLKRETSPSAEASTARGDTCRRQGTAINPSLCGQFQPLLPFSVARALSASVQSSPLPVKPKHTGYVKTVKSVVRAA